jgi:hypothetical protein
MKQPQILSEVHRIREMMGLSENRYILKESIGDEIAELLIKFFRKDIDELTALGIRNAEDLKGLMDDFVNPAINSAAKVDILRSILDDIGEVGAKTIAKGAIDDVTSGVGKLVDDNMGRYLDAYKKGLMTYDEVVSELTDDLSKLMSKSGDELTTLKSALNDEALLKAKNQLDNAAGTGRSVDTTIDDAYEQLLKENAKADKVLNKFKSNPEWDKLKGWQQVGLEDFVSKNKDLDFVTLITRTDEYFKKALTENITNKTLREKIYKKWRGLKPWQKWGIGIAIAGGIYKSTGGTAACSVRNTLDWMGEWLGAWDFEDQEAWNKCDFGVQPKDEETTATCDQTLDKFKAYLNGEGYSETTQASATWNVETCTGTVTLGDNTVATFTYKDGSYK